MRSHCYLCMSMSKCPSNEFLLAYSLVSEPLPKMVVSSGFTISTFRQRVTLYSKVVGRCVSYLVLFVSNAQYLMKREYTINYSVQKMFYV
jgi:hypothetical protein